MKIPLLCYHSTHAALTYKDDDHAALAEDLRVIHRMGFEIVPLDLVVDAIAEPSRAREKRWVALTCDDGVDMDWVDVIHPTVGARASFATILRDFIDEFGRNAQPRLQMTAFVIASPVARKELETICLAGHPWWNDTWWAAAEKSRLFRIENHSWDHVHPGLSCVGQQDGIMGDFRRVDSYGDCVTQVDHASDFIASKTGRHPQYFAYPYGQCSDYLRDTYLPAQAGRRPIRAAFTTAATYVMPSCNRWAIPRFTHGADWTSTDELETLLVGSLAR